MNAGRSWKRTADSFVMKPFVYSIWLMPCAEQRAVLGQVISDLASRCDALSFISHATLCSGEWSGEQSTLSAVFKVLAGRLPPTVRFDSMALVRPSTGHWEDVKSWEILCSADLSG